MIATTQTPYRPLAVMQLLDPGTGKSTPITGITQFAEGVAPYARGDTFDFGGHKYAVISVDSLNLVRRSLDGPPEPVGGFALTAVPLNDRGDWPGSK